MAPPGYTALSAITADPKYLEFSDQEYWATTDLLFQDIPELAGGLFLRDSTFFDAKDANGNSVYWSRGNGWVFAGLPAIIDRLPETFSSRTRCAAAPFDTSSHSHRDMSSYR
jgi:unsaturated rhamnogalacturonyl hydrolase